MISSLVDILELSRHQEILDDVYVIGEGAAPSNIPAAGNDVPRLLTTQSNNRVRYAITEASQSYTVFVSRYVPTNNHWRANGRSPDLMNLGMMPTFAGTGQGTTIYFTRWTWLVWLETLALAVTVLSLAYLWPQILETTSIKAASQDIIHWAARLKRINVIRRKRPKKSPRRL